jgi:hypothetical protein
VGRANSRLRVDVGGSITATGATKRSVIVEVVAKFRGAIRVGKAAGRRVAKTVQRCSRFDVSEDPVAFPL